MEVCNKLFENCAKEKHIKEKHVKEKHIKEKHIKEKHIKERLIKRLQVPPKYSHPCIRAWSDLYIEVWT